MTVQIAPNRPQHTGMALSTQGSVAAWEVTFHLDGDESVHAAISIPLAGPSTHHEAKQVTVASERNARKMVLPRDMMLAESISVEIQASGNHAISATSSLTCGGVKWLASMKNYSASRS